MVDLPEPGMPTKAQRICINGVSCTHVGVAHEGAAASALSERACALGTECKAPTRPSLEIASAAPVQTGGVRFQSAAYTSAGNSSHR
jgi:hypothetical protein